MRSVEQHSILAVQPSILAILGTGLVPADTPFLRADDLGVLRGDGAFETMHVRERRPWLIAEHLDRLARSARTLELNLPPRADLEELAALACSQWPLDAEGALRIVVTRGPEHGDGTPTAYATLNPIDPARSRVRRDGLTAVTATLGYAVGARSADSPWLLGGAKTLSYAVNMASTRYGIGQGVDDVLWVSADGYALEAPTSSLAWLDGDELCTVPADRAGILEGLTVRALQKVAGEFGWTAAERMVRPAELSTMDGVWLTSSVRGVVAIRELDGVHLGISEHTPRLLERLGFSIPA
jgi:4-amino-4-deoxychorismate lyase